MRLDQIFRARFEIPSSLLKRSLVCPDFLEQALKEGECQQLSTDEIGPSLGEVIKNNKKYSNVKNQINGF